MTTSRKQLREEVRTIYLEEVINLFNTKGDEVLRIKSNEIAIPVVDREGNEDFVKIAFSVPIGSNKGTEPFDAYELAEEYQLKLKEKEEKQNSPKKRKQRKLNRIKREGRNLKK